MRPELEMAVAPVAVVPAVLVATMLVLDLNDLKRIVGDDCAGAHVIGFRRGRNCQDADGKGDGAQDFLGHYSVFLLGLGLGVVAFDADRYDGFLYRRDFPIVLFVFLLFRLDFSAAVFGSKTPKDQAIGLKGILFNQTVD